MRCMTTFMSQKNTLYVQSICESLYVETVVAE